jgi:Heparinase II/III-like protein/Heparinase II/III N-terminus
MGPMGTAVGDAALDAIRGEGLSRDARGLQLPEAQVVGPRPRRRPTRKAMLAGLFYVFGEEARLEPPIDWLQGLQASRSWRYELHTLTWLKEALARHAAGGDVETLAVARDAALDWARAHLGGDGARPGGPDAERSEFAWYDMAVGLRAPYLAYVLRACLAEGRLDDEGAELLLEAVERHGAVLADGRRYAAANNHGLYQDEGLYLLARLLLALPAAPAWRELALQRLRSTLAATVSFAEGAHLEHSTAYQFAVLDLVARLAANVEELPELGPLLDRMRHTAAWQTTPAGRMAQLGDTDDLPAPRWAREAAAPLRGMRVLPEAGQAFVRDGESYLAVTAAHHGAAHKHADDAGFLLIERGRIVLGDAGRYGYYEDEPDRIYARAAAAHNVLNVDGRDFEWRAAEPYGSGLGPAREREGWYTIAARNPLLERQGVEHRRTFFYRPAEALVVLDEVGAADAHEYVRRFHLGAELEAELDGEDAVKITGRGIAAKLFELGGDAELSLERGVEEPRLGWTYPADRERDEAWTATLRARRAGDAAFAAALSLDGAPPAELPAAVGRRL